MANNDQNSGIASLQTKYPESYTIEDLYQKALGRKADTGGLEYWQKEIGPTAEGDEIMRFLQIAQPELLRTGINPFTGQTVDATTGRVKTTQPASNPYLDYREKMFELGDIEHPRGAHIETAFEDYLADQQRYATTGSKKTPEKLARRAKPNIAQFMDATGADFNTASEVLYGLVGSNQDRRDWKKVMASKDPYTAAVAGLGQMYGGYGVQVSNPDERERQRVFLTTGQGTPLRMLGRYEPTTKAIDISPKEAAEYYNRAGVDIGALARRAGLNIAPRYDPTTSPYDFSALINYLLGGKG